MHVLVVTQFHRQPGRGGGARLNELARVWSGHGVTVIAGTVDHASGRVPPGYRGRWLVEEQTDGARVLRTWTLNPNAIAHDASQCSTKSP